MRIVIVVAHPDDAEIFAGGMIGAWRHMGAEVTIVVVSDGRLGGSGDPVDLVARRAIEAREAAKILDAGLVLMGYPDGSLDGAALVAPLADQLTGLEPDLVLTHPPKDYHADHRAVSEATGRAVSFRAPVVWLEPMMGLGFRPTHWIDTTPFTDTKERAIRCHQSQDPERFVTKSRILGQMRAAQCGWEGMAETVCHEPVYPFADIRDFLPPPPPLHPVVDRGRGA